MGTIKFYPYKQYDLRTSKKLLKEIFNKLPIIFTLLSQDYDPYIGRHWNVFYWSHDISLIYHKTCKKNAFKDKRIFLYSQPTFPLIYPTKEIDSAAWKKYIQYCERREREEFTRQYMYALTAVVAAARGRLNNIK